MADYNKALADLRSRIAEEVKWGKERIEHEAAVVVAGLEAQADLAERYRALESLGRDAVFYRAVPWTASRDRMIPLHVVMADNWPVNLDPRPSDADFAAAKAGDYYLVVALIPRAKP